MVCPSLPAATLQKRRNICVDLSDLPLGILRRAQQFVSQDNANFEDSDTGDEGESSYDGTHSKAKNKEMSERGRKPRSTIAKRLNKHA